MACGLRRVSRSEPRTVNRPVRFGVALLLLGWTTAPAIAETPPGGAAAGEKPAAAESAPASSTREAPREEWADLSLEQLLRLRVTAASRTAEKASEAPATVYVISRHDIRARGYSTLVDVLKDLPGMETVEQYYSEQGTLVPVRGVVGNNKIVLLINGMRVNPPGGEELMIRNDVSVRTAEQIEVIYGPGSTLHGQDAISAVINIKTQDPATAVDEVLGGYGNDSSREGFGAFGTQLRQGGDNPVSVSGFVSARGSDLANFRTSFPDWWTHYEGPLTAKGRSLDPVRGDRGYNAFARIEAGHASVQGWFRESSRSSSEGSGEGGINPVLFFVDEARWRDRSVVVEGQHSLTLATGVSLSSILALNHYETMPESRYVWPPSADSLFLRDFKYAVGTGLTLEEKLDWEVDRNTRLTMGLVASNYDVVPKTTVLDGANPDLGIVTQAGALTYYTQAGNPASRVDLNRAVDLHYQQYGAYAEGAYRLRDDLRAIAGVRVDVNSRFERVPVSPRAALVYNTLGERLTLKYVFSTAYVAPAPYFGYNVFDNGVQISSGNPDLEPEKAISNEINAVWQTGKLLLSGSLYYNHQSNLLVTSQSEAPETVVLERVFTNPDGTGPRMLTRSTNIGSSNARGFDMHGRYDVGPLSAWASYSFVDFTRDISGVKAGLAQISAHNVRAGLTWSVLPELSVTPSLVLRSTPQNLTASYQGLGISLETPYQVNLHALFAPSKRFDVFATVRNLTNHKYALRGVAGPALQEPFSVIAGIRLRH